MSWVSRHSRFINRLQRIAREYCERPFKGVSWQMKAARIDGPLRV